MPIFHLVVDEILQYQLRVSAPTEEEAGLLVVSEDSLTQFQLGGSPVERTIDIKACFDIAHPEIALRTEIRSKLTSLEEFVKRAPPEKLAAMAGLLALINPELS